MPSPQKGREHEIKDHKDDATHSHQPVGPGYVGLPIKAGGKVMSDTDLSSRAVTGSVIARACAEIILEHAPAGDRKAIDQLKARIIHQANSSDGELKPDDVAIATITATIGTTVDTSYITNVNITDLKRRGAGEA